MNSADQKDIAIFRIEESISELRDEHKLIQAAITEGRIKGFLELSFAIGLLSQKEHKVLWERFAAVREEIYERFKSQSE